MKGRTLVAVLLLASMILPGCGGREARQYTIEQFLNTVSIFGASFSFDESKILFTSNETGIYNAYTIPVAGGEAEQVTHSTDNSVFAVSYFPEDDRMLYLSDSGGNEIYHIYMTGLDGASKDLTPFEGARSTFYSWSRDGRSFFFGCNRRDARFTDLYEMDLETFAPELVFENDGGYEIGDISNDKRYIALSKTITEHNSDIYLYDRKNKTTKHITAHEGDINNMPSGFTVDSKKLFFLTDEGSEFVYLKAYDISSGEAETVETAEWDISYSYVSWNGRYRVTAINNDARTEIRIHDLVTGGLVDLPEMPEGVITSVGISKSENLMSFYVNGSRSPSDLYVYDFRSGEYRKLTDSLNPEIDRRDLVDAEVVRYESFDGLEIPAIFYKPHGAGRGCRIPALVWVHGGPGGQARVGYSSFIQYLVNHGYAVLAVNNRGSSGYGKTFYKLDDLNHGKGDLDDCVEAKNHLASKGYIDEAGIGIGGGSYGGYMVLAALAFRPEEFAAGVDLFGISNWVRTLQSIPSWWESFREALYAELGNPETDEEYLRSISPLFHADKIVRPLMVLQGANDPRVLKAESDEIVEAVRANGVPVEYLVFEDEGHGFVKKENQIEGYRAILAFLDEHLKKTE
ncbi:MAG TPA: S9 family peptidase [Candidatus Eisenbacteria bacterium]|uniref:Acyl-peptide hydrolase n=1 Tax=Eiseniibacteriota bacterium TaxID=2212470 RepID=A0A7V2ATI7_UNCEI|nr:S9 family peptidase [Candidatus Eisenbacteria bacterium]